MNSGKLIRFLKNNFFDPIYSFMFPALCIVCSSLLENEEHITCTRCLSKLTPLDRKYINDLKDEIKPSYFDQLFVLFEFDTVFQILIHHLKYQRFTSLALFFAACLETKVNNPYDLVTAVPLNSVRERERGYNQSNLIARHFASITGLKHSENILLRTRNTPSQTKLNRKQRIENMQTAFKLNGNINGKTVLLIDDVITTGSTVNACAKELKANGAKKVDVAILATPVDYFQQTLEKEGLSSETIDERT